MAQLPTTRRNYVANFKTHDLKLQVVKTEVMTDYEEVPDDKYSLYFLTGRWC